MSSKFYKFFVLPAVSLFIILALCQSDVFAAKKEKALKKTSATSKAYTDKNTHGQAAEAKQSAPIAVPEQAAAPTGGVIKFEKAGHDFGEVKPDSISECNFVFTNVGKGPLQITGTKGTCKCTVPDLQKKDYLPGESGAMKVSFHAPKYQGEATQHVFVFSNDANTPKAELEIKAYVRSQVQVSPEKLNLSLIAANGDVNAITIKSIDNETFAITKITSMGDVFKFTWDPNEVSAIHTLKPTINVENLKKYLNGTILFEINHPACKDVKVDYACLREFEASPSAIIVRDAVENTAQQRAVYIVSNYNQKFEIESIVSEKGTVKVLEQRTTESRCEFEISIMPPVRQGALRVFSDTLRIKIKGKETIDIPCRGFYKVSK